MNFTELVSKRRAYRKLQPVEITSEIIKELAEITKFAPSCENKQPWRFVFIYDQEKLAELNESFHNRNKWVTNASLLIGVFSSRDLDCIIDDREYYLFDTGIAVTYIMLRATEMGLVAHPISYYDEMKAKQIMNVPDDMELITILVVGKQSDTIKVQLSPDQEQAESERPRRLSLQYLNYINNYVEEYEENKERFSQIFEE
jgi:nitroreductase